MKTPLMQKSRDGDDGFSKQDEPAEAYSRISNMPRRFMVFHAAIVAC